MDVLAFGLSSAAVLYFFNRKNNTDTTQDSIVGAKDNDRNGNGTSRSLPWHLARDAPAADHYNDSSRNDKNDALLQQSLREGKSRNATEMVCIVDENNVLIPNGACHRSEMRVHNKWHRATYVLILQYQRR